MELHPLMIGMPRGQRLRVKDCWSNVERSVLISIKSVYRSFGDIEALRGIDLKVNEGEFISILGPSGCGKTTLLRIIGGLNSLTLAMCLLEEQILMVFHHINDR